MNSFNLDFILVIIPALDEEATIAQVIQSLQSIGLYHIRVVDNGSCDRTAEVASNVGAAVLQEPIPGYGRACWRGLQAIPDFIEWILFCDGDGSDDLSALNRFLSCCDLSSRDASSQQQSHYCDLILGDRTATAAGRTALTSVQCFGNALLTWQLLLMHLPSPFSGMPQALSPLPERERDFQSGSPSPVLGEGV